MSQAWWQDFFDEEYVEVWGGLFTAAGNALEAQGLYSMLKLAPGAKVLDAPCGYGRLSRAFAELGCNVVGVDFSVRLLDHAESRRGDFSVDRLRYVRSDLRYRHESVREGSFDAAINAFSSLGYGSDDDDQLILTNLARALRPGGFLFVDTMHRDAIIIRLERGLLGGKELDNGVRIEEHPRLDPVSGRIETTWRWTTPSGGRGQKSASIRIYSITELISKVEDAGFEIVSLHKGCSAEPFDCQDLAQRVGVLATKVH